MMQGARTEVSSNFARIISTLVCTLQHSKSQWSAKMSSRRYTYLRSPTTPDWADVLGRHELTWGSTWQIALWRHVDSCRAGQFWTLRGYLTLNNVQFHMGIHEGTYSYIYDNATLQLVNVPRMNPTSSLQRCTHEWHHSRTAGMRHILQAAPVTLVLGTHKLRSTGHLLVYCRGENTNSIQYEYSQFVQLL